MNAVRKCVPCGQAAVPAATAGGHKAKLTTECERCLAARKVLLFGIPPILLWLGFAWWMGWLAHCAACAVR